jgi:hypothetical protein
LYYATGNLTYLELVTQPSIAEQAGASGGWKYYGVFDWDNKLTGAQVSKLSPKSNKYLHINLTMIGNFFSSVPRGYHIKHAQNEKQTCTSTCCSWSSFPLFHSQNGKQTFT